MICNCVRDRTQELLGAYPLGFAAKRAKRNGSPGGEGAALKAPVAVGGTIAPTITPPCTSRPPRRCGIVQSDWIKSRNARICVRYRTDPADSCSRDATFTGATFGFDALYSYRSSPHRRWID